MSFVTISINIITAVIDKGRATFRTILRRMQDLFSDEWQQYTPQCNTIFTMAFAIVKDVVINGPKNTKQGGKQL